MSTTHISLLDHIKTRDAYREMREHIFPSESSLEWFKNRLQLSAVKALLVINGRVFVNEREFDGFLLELGQSAGAS